MSQTQTSADPAGDSFALAVQDILHAQGYDALLEGETAQAIIAAYASRIATERQRSEKLAAEVRVLVDRDQAKDLIMGQMKVVVGQQLVSNSRAHAHISFLAGQINALQHLAEPKDSGPQVDRDAILVILEERQFRGVQDHPIVAGFAPSREYAMGRFRREYTDLPVHFAFIGWSLVVGNTHRLPLTSLLEATFQVDGRPVPASQLGARGLALETLLP